MSIHQIGRLVADSAHLSTLEKIDEISPPWPSCWTITFRRRNVSYRVKGFQVRIPTIYGRAAG